MSIKSPEAKQPVFQLECNNMKPLSANDKVCVIVTLLLEQATRCGMNDRDGESIYNQLMPYCCDERINKLLLEMIRDVLDRPDDIFSRN